MHTNDIFDPLIPEKRNQRIRTYHKNGKQTTRSDYNSIDNGVSYSHEDEAQAFQKKWSKMVILAFACLGNLSGMATRLFPTGFYIEFLVERGLNKTIGTFCISMTLITSAISPYIFNCLPESIKQVSLSKRCLVLFTLNALFLALMSLLDFSLEKFPNGEVAFTMIFVLRALQGVTIGLSFVIVQGEIVDLYLKENKLDIVIISSSLHLANILCSIMAVRLYIWGGWLSVGVGITLLSLLPLLLLPALNTYQNRFENENQERSRREEVREHQLSGREGANENQRSGRRNVMNDDLPVDESKLTWLRKLTYYMPDMAVFLNNTMFCLLIYALPARMVHNLDRDLDTTILYINLINVFSLVAALTLGYLAEKMFNIFNVIMVGNVVYYVGCIMTFGSTTEFLRIPASFEVGAVMVGIGDAAVINLAIMSKFVMYNRWGLSTKGLGARSTAINNLVFNLAAAAGTIVSGLALTRESEIPAMATAVAVFFVVSIGLVMCRIVK